MGKLAPARVSYWNDFLISYRVYRLMSHFISLLYEGTFHVDKIQERAKIADITVCMRYLFQSTGRPISHQNKWSLRCSQHTVAKFHTLALVQQPG